MATFDYPYHVVEEEWPEQTKMQFGRGYQFNVKPKGPEQVIYRLHFATMKVQWTGAGAVSRTNNPQINILHLKDFYKAHGMHTTFVYPHPEEGNINVRFNKPLSFKYSVGGLGSVEPFSLEFILQP